MKKEMLINVLQPEECRIAIVEDGVLEELYVERTSHESFVGNIYKGRIVNIEPSIQAAFVDFGVGRNGFLHVSDVEPAYYRHLEPWRNEPDRRGGGGRRGGGRRGPRRDAEPDPVEPELPVDELDDDELASLSFDEAAEVIEHIGEPDGGRFDDEPSDEAPVRGRGDDDRFEDDDTPAADVDDAPLEPEEPASEYDDAAFTPAAGVDTAEDKDWDANAEEESASEPSTLMMQSTERRTEPASPIDDEELSFSMRAERRTEVEEPPAAESDTEEALEGPQDLRPPRQQRGGRRGDNDGRRPRRGRDDRRGGGRGGRRDDRRGGGGRRGGPMRNAMGRPKPLIQDIFRKGQEVLVQVIKEGIGTKGPTLSTYISIAGRYLVLMPGLNRIGVSRKITDEEQRRRLREILNDLKPPRGIGFIIRTAGMDRTKQELQRDLAYLARLWQVVVRRIRKLKSPTEIYQESDMITRTIRDTFTSEIDTIWVDESKAFEHAQEFLQIVMPRYASRIKCYSDNEPIFHRYSIEEEITRIHKRHVPLPNGGSIVIDQTEALVAIDVNSGNFRADNNAEETAYQMNILAAREIARQLRLRDLGGVIVNDFIDMREEKHRRNVERALRDAVRRDRARTKILRMSQFGIIEMTRQRIRPSLKRSSYQDCPHCGGTGQVKTCESISIEVMRQLQLAAHRDSIQRVQIRVHDDVASYLSNRKRVEIARLEETREVQVIINGDRGVSPETMEFNCFDRNNSEVKFPPFEPPPTHRRGR